MAFVTLNADQKAQLRAYSGFRAEVVDAVQQQARYWIDPAQEATIPGGNKSRWAKSRFFSAQTLQAPGQIEGQVNDWANYFTIFMVQAVWDNSVTFDVAVVTAYIKAQGYFPGYADQSFDEKIKSLIF